MFCTLVFLLALSISVSEVLMAATMQSSRLDVEHSWPNGMTAHICMDHGLKIRCGWEMEIVFSKPITIMQIWDARITSTNPHNGGTKVTIKNKHWNKVEATGTCHRFNVHFNTGQPDATALYTSVCANNEFKDVPRPESELTDQLSMLDIEHQWPGGMTTHICMNHQLDITCGWELEMLFSAPISSMEIWDAVIKSKTPYEGGTRVVIRNVDWNEKELNGTCHRFNAYFGGERPAAKAQYIKICTGGKWTDLSGEDSDVTDQPPVFAEPGPEDFAVSIESSWAKGIVGYICLFHTAPITCGYDVEIIVSAPVKKFRIWSMAVVDEIESNGMIRYQLTNMVHSPAQTDNPTCHRFLIKHRPGKKPSVIKGHYTRSCHNEQDDNDPNQGGTVPPPTTQAATTEQPTTNEGSTAKPTNNPTTSDGSTVNPTNKPTTSEGSTVNPTNKPTTSEGSTVNPTNKPTASEESTVNPTNKPTTSEGSTVNPTNKATTNSDTTTDKSESTTNQETEISSSPTTQSVPPYIPSEPEYNYGEALNKSMQFYFAQRSGPISDKIVPWRTANSAMTDGNDVSRDLVGGWYDAGDYVKFGFPMAASATNLLWGLLEYEMAYRATGELEMMYSLIRHPLEYFLKCWDNDNQIFYGQVGNGHIDHAYWGRPEDMDMNRPTYKLDANHGGSDLAAETAASLSAGYLVFKDKDGAFAQKMLVASKQLYKFADMYRQEYHNSITNAAPFYRSHSGYQDELCWGAAWIYAATGDSHYKTKAKEAMRNMDQNPSEFSFDSKAIGCYTLMLKIGDAADKSEATTKVTDFMQRWLNFNNGITKTPCGLAWLREWGSLRYSANTALIALMAADQGVNPEQFREWAEKQIKYMLGANNKRISYMIGYGSQSPRSPHHGAASCPLAPAPCSWDNFHTQSPNPNELTGALVGGPGKYDDYEDKRSDYAKNEVTTDYNAGFQSVLAGLVNLDLQGSLPKAAPTC